MKRLPALFIMNIENSIFLGGRHVERVTEFRSIWQKRLPFSLHSSFGKLLLFWPLIDLWSPFHLHCLQWLNFSVASGREMWPNYVRLYGWQQPVLYMFSLFRISALRVYSFLPTYARITNLWPWFSYKKSVDFLRVPWRIFCCRLRAQPKYHIVTIQDGVENCFQYSLIMHSYPKQLIIFHKDIRARAPIAPASMRLEKEFRHYFYRNFYNPKRIVESVVATKDLWNTMLQLWLELRHAEGVRWSPKQSQWLYSEISVYYSWKSRRTRVSPFAETCLRVVMSNGSPAGSA